VQASFLPLITPPTKTACQQHENDIIDGKLKRFTDFRSFWSETILLCWIPIWPFFSFVSLLNTCLTIPIIYLELVEVFKSKFFPKLQSLKLLKVSMKSILISFDLTLGVSVNAGTR